MRVCAYWSSKYNYLHPGTIVENTQVRTKVTRLTRSPFLPFRSFIAFPYFFTIVNFSSIVSFPSKRSFRKIVGAVKQNSFCSQKILVVLINFVCTQKLCPSLTVQTILYCQCYEPNISMVSLKSSIVSVTSQIYPWYPLNPLLLVLRAKYIHGIP